MQLMVFDASSISHDFFEQDLQNISLYQQSCLIIYKIGLYIQYFQSYQEKKYEDVYQQINIKKNPHVYHLFTNTLLLSQLRGKIRSFKVEWTILKTFSHRNQFAMNHQWAHFLERLILISTRNIQILQPHYEVLIITRPIVSRILDLIKQLYKHPYRWATGLIDTKYSVIIISTTEQLLLKQFSKVFQCNIFSFQPQKQNLTTVIISVNHQQSDLQLDVQGSFWCSATDPLACEKIAIKNLVIVTKECHQSCLTCDGPNINDCLSCPSGPLLQGTCTCTLGFAHQHECVSACPQFYQNQNGQCVLEYNKCSQCANNYYNVNGICYQQCPSHAIVQGQKCLDYSELSQFGSNYIDQFFTNGIKSLYQILQSIYVERHSNSGQGQGQDIVLTQVQSYHSIYNNKLLLGGLGIWTDIEYCFKYSELPPHNNLVIYVTAYFIDNWDGDKLKIYMQMGMLNLRQKQNKIQNIQLSIKHTSSTLQLAFSPQVSSNNYEASFAISDLYILADNCDNNCIKCGESSCVTCENGYQLINKKCTLCDNSNCNSCQPGQYLNTSNLKCKSCISNCAQCTSQNSCQLCNSGYYNLNNVCNKCIQNCSDCTQSSTCTKCQAGYVLDINNQCSSCSSNQLVINNQCQNCSSRCSSCSVNQQNCLICENNRINPPLCNCDDGYYEESSICIKCSDQCETCISKTDCIICAANRIRPPFCGCPPDSFENLQIGNTYCSTCELGIGIAYFADNLNEIIIDFGQPIQNLQISCQQILTQEILDKIGQKKVCFIRNSLIIIQLDSFSTIQPGEQIQIVPYQLKFTNCPNLLQNIENIPILKPKNEVIPEIIFNTTLIQHSSCQDSIIQISKIINDGTRPLTLVQWVVLDDSNLNHFTILEDYLNKHIYNNTIIIPSNLTFQSESYTLTLIFMNFLQNQGKQVIQLLNNKRPIIISTFNNQSTYYNYQKINFINNPYLLQCENIYKTTNKIIHFKIIGQQKYLEQFNQSTIDIKLEPYNFTFSGTYDNAGRILSQLSFRQPNLHIIERDWNQNRIIGFNQELQLNLEIINPNNLTSQIDFDIHWMCVQPMITKECKDSNGNFITFNNSQIQIFKERTFEPFQVIIITAKSIIGGKVYQSSTTIQFIETNLPQFRILVNNQTYFQKLNYYDEIYIELEYPIEKDPDDLFFNMQLGVDNYTVESFRFYNYKLKFRVREKIQQTELETLHVKFSIYNPDFYTASANQIQIYLNDPPKQCIITANQTENITIIDNILITVNNCVDDEYPLSFMFVFYDDKDDFTQDQSQSQLVRGVILQNFSLSNQIVIRLYEAQFNLIQVFVMDSYNGFSNFTLQFNYSFSNVTITQDQLLQIINREQNNKVQLFIDFMAVSGYIMMKNITMPQQLQQFIVNTSNPFKHDDEINDMYFEIQNRLIQSKGFINSRDQINKYLGFIKHQLSIIDSTIPNIFSYSVILNYNSIIELQKLKLVDRIRKYTHFVNQLFQINFQTADLQDSQVVDQNFINQKIIETIDQLLQTITPIQFINEDTFIIDTKMIQLQVSKLSHQRVINKFGQILDYETSINRQLMQINKLEYIYNLGIYQNNPYQNMSEFKQNYKQSSQTTLFKPTLTLSGQPINQTLPVPYQFKNTSQQSSICVQRLNNIWQAQSCKTKVILDETICICEQISPTTIINAFINVQGQIFRIFSSDSIDKIQNYPFQKVVFIYIIIFYSLTYVWLMYKSNKLDLMEKNPEQFSEKVHPSHPLENIQDQQDVHDQVKQADVECTKTYISKMLQRLSIKRCISQNKLKINLKEQTNSYTRMQYMKTHFTQIKGELVLNNHYSTQQEENFDILSPDECLHSVEPQNSPKLVIKTSTDGTSIQCQEKESPKVQINLKSKIERGDINTYQGFIQYFKHFHVFFGIYFRYCDDQNRLLRCTLVYMSLLGQICILIVFGNQLNLSTILVLSFCQNVFGFIYKKLMAFLLNTNNLFIKYLGFNMTLLQCGNFYFIILASSCKYDSIFVANLWAASYICSFFLDYFVYSTIIMAVVFIINLKIHKYNNLQKLSQIILDKPQYAFFFGE
ncbi:hypothetical protein pb186bvf_004616 [Paramecium bursaria]